MRYFKIDIDIFNTYKNEKNTTAFKHKNFGIGFIGLSSS